MPAARKFASRIAEISMRAEQRLQCGTQHLIGSALRRQQDDGVIRRYRVLGSSSTTRSYFAISPSLV